MIHVSSSGRERPGCQTTAHRTSLVPRHSSFLVPSPDTGVTVLVQKFGTRVSDTQVGRGVRSEWRTLAVSDLHS